MLDVTNTPAVETTPAVHGHFAVCLYDLTIAELVAEWLRLNKWEETDEYGDHGDCRLDRMSEIEDLLMRRDTKTPADVILKWRVLELLECTDNQDHKSIVEIFRWGRDRSEWSARAAFDHCRTQELLHSILGDLHSLACPERKS